MKPLLSLLFQKGEGHYPILYILCALGAQEFLILQDTRALWGYNCSISQLQELYSLQSMFSFTLVFHLHSSLIRIIFIPDFYMKKWIFREIKCVSQGYTEQDSKPDLTVILMFWVWLAYLKKLNNPSKQKGKKRVSGTWTKTSNNQNMRAENRTLKILCWTLTIQSKPHWVATAQTATPENTSL